MDNFHLFVEQHIITEQTIFKKILVAVDEINNDTQTGKFMF